MPWRLRPTSAKAAAKPAAAPDLHADESQEEQRLWEFWIDVGGTFIDCIARSPDGNLTSAKLLSSGRFKGRVEDYDADAVRLIDTGRNESTNDFFAGYTLVIPGDEAEEHRVTAYDPATHTLLLADAPSRAIAPGASYELHSPEPGPITAIRLLRGLRIDESIGPCRVRLGTTRGTNALLERKGATVGLVTTQGFADVIDIGTQARPDLFTLDIVRPAKLCQHVAEVHERIDARGNVVRPLDIADVRRAIDSLRRRGATAIAICFVNAYRNAEHERIAATVAREVGCSQVSVSSELSPTINLLDRCQTTVVDAYLSPVIRDYVAQVRDALPEGEVKLMTSSGGLVDADAFAGKDCILSGPAGGVVGFAHAAREAGFDRAIGFDMGGTSTDVSRFAGEYEYEFTGEKAGVRLVTPMYAIETVAAGGGSVCDFDGQRLTVGPGSAGADPGPACYGRGGPLTVTDINLFNGKIDEQRFPFPLDKQVVQQRLEAMAARVAQSGGGRMTPHQLADGFTRVANQVMAEAITRISSARGLDPAEHALVSFGGAGAQHACAIARILGIRTILLHPMAGILSALGMGVADVRRFAERTVIKPLDGDSLESLDTRFRALERRLTEEVRDEGIDEDDIEVTRMLDLRYKGQDAAITVRKPTDEGDWRVSFETMHEQLYGHTHRDRAVEIAAMRVEVVGRTTKPVTASKEEQHRELERDSVTVAHFGGQPQKTDVYARERLEPGDRFDGPAIVTEAHSTIVIDPGWSAQVTGRGDLILTDAQHGCVTVKGGSASDAAEFIVSAANTSTRRDPVRLELFNNHFTHIARLMGQTLQRTAMSVNVKDRLDFSCAILDAQGHLVVNAPHIPVHLGAMGEAVKALLRRERDLAPGDVYVSNDPALGGSHLPDVTVMSPVFNESGNVLRFVIASRAHHAEIGGVRPGSTFPFAKRLAEEGVVLRNLRVARGGVFDEATLRTALTTGLYPSRNPDENIADIRAAVAANRQGIVELGRMVDEQTWPVVAAYMAHIRDAAEEKTRAAIARIGDGEYGFEDQLDDGSPIRVCITVCGEHMTVDFTGSASVHPLSLNANRAIVQSAVMYCMRCLIDEPIPLNAGVLAPIELVIPHGLLNPPVENDPTAQPAVVGGNVEVSQRIVDVILGALGVAAASQGTMNNFVFGSGRFGYYETICGGSGATANANGASAVHTHMTNTRLTDVEVLEQRYPVRVERFGIRRGSGGSTWSGGHRGGDGVIRAIRFLEPLDVSLLTQRRTVAPFGLHGGGPGQCGMNLIKRHNGDSIEQLDSLAQVSVEPGDVIEIHTPGGGAFGTTA